MITLYGIKQCDTVKKAQKWLKDHNIPFHFHDVREDGIDALTIEQWLTESDIDTLVNRRSTTWRNLPDSTKENLSAENATELLLANPTLIKRPVLRSKDKLLIGFKAEHYKKAL